jgi:hypothetical protein
MLLTERFAAGRSMNSLVTGLARHGAEISAATLAGTCAQAAGLLAPLAEAIAERNRDSWHLHADETTWRVFAPGEGKGPAKWWLWVFIGADTVCFVMDPSRSGTVLARHAGLDEETGQLLPAADGGPRRLVISSDFYAVYQSAGRKADGLVNLYCAAHVRRHFVRAGDASPVQLKYWTENWLALIRDLYAAHDENPRRKRSPPWTASGTGSSPTAATRWRDLIITSRSGRSAGRSSPARTPADPITGAPPATPP